MGFALLAVATKANFYEVKRSDCTHHDADREEEPTCSCVVVDDRSDATPCHRTCNKDAHRVPREIFASTNDSSVWRDLLGRCCHRAKTYQRNQISQNGASPYKGVLLGVRDTGFCNNPRLKTQRNDGAHQEG